MRAGWTALLLSSIACSPEFQAPACSVRCGDGVCPSGLSCAADGYCHAPGENMRCAGPVACTSGSSECRFLLPIGQGLLAYYGTFSLETSPAGLERAVIVVHGSNRDPTNSFANILEAVAADGSSLSTLLVIAPHFQSVAASPRELYWTSGDWREGGDGSDGASQPASSFAALDALVTRLADRTRFPRLTDVVLAGHGAGGQVIQHYAAAALSEPSQPGVRHVVANPSSYLYLNELRFVGNMFTSTGSTFTSCPSYDDYKFGLKNRGAVPYVAGMTDADLRARYVDRRVFYLLGQQDTCNSNLASCEDFGLEKECEAMLQGVHRLERGQRFFSYLQTYFNVAHHTMQVVPDVANDESGVWRSAEGRSALFH